MQSIYAMDQSKSDDLDKQEKFLKYSQDAVQDLYLVMLSLLVEVGKAEQLFLELSSKKHLATADEKKPNFKFVENPVFQILANSNALSIALADRKINHWNLHSDYVQMILTAIKSSDFFENYFENNKTTFQDHIDFVVNI